LPAPVWSKEYPAATTSLRPHLDEGYAELLDSFGNVAGEWHDKKYAKAIQNGECCLERWHETFHDLARRGGIIALLEGCRWIAVKGPLEFDKVH
jgi:hypothetical protein